MSTRYILLIIFSVVLSSSFVTDSVFAQDSTVVDTTNRIAQQDVQEMVLMDISIIAAVERPSVAIIPRRDKPNFESIMFLQRSFDRELKEIPIRLISFDEKLESARKIERLKKLLVKEKK